MFLSRLAHKPGSISQALSNTSVAALCCLILLYSFLATQAQAQTPTYNCRPNSTGDGWICESEDGAPLPNTADGANQYNSDNAVLPGPVPAPEPDAVDAAETSDEDSAESEPSAEPERASYVPRRIPNPASYPLDWVPREAMSAEQLAELDANCCGAFIDPLQELAVTPQGPAAAETVLQSSAGLKQISPTLTDFNGEVIVQQGSRTIRNDQGASVDQANDTIVMQGNITFRELGLLLQGNSAYIDNQAGVNRIENAQYVIHDFGAHGDAESIVYNSDSGLVTIENGMFSRCEPANEFWTLSASSIVLDQENSRGYARQASVRLGNVPVFYYPWTLPFPLGDARASGVLPPSIGSTRTGGADIEVPYYFNLAPHYDATIAPRIISDRGLMLGLEARYLASWSMNTLNLSHLAGDDLFNPDTIDIPAADTPPVEDRWFIGFEHQGAIGRNWSTFVDYSAVSDDDYFYDLGGNGLNVVSRTHLNRQGRLNFNSDFLRAGVNVQRIQIIDPFVNATDINRPFDRLPEFFFETNTDLPAGFNIGLSGQVTSFDRSLDENFLSPEQIENGALVTGERINLEPNLGWSLESPGWFVRGNATYKHVSYSLENQALGTLEDPDLNIGVYSFDSGLIFERQGREGRSQTLEPRLFYLYSEYEDQSMIPLFDTSELNFSFNQLFREDRFGGGDRIADADQVTLALTSRFLDAKGAERARMSLGQIRYFQDRQVTLSNPLQNWQPRYSPVSDSSAYVGEVALSLGNNWRLNTDIQWDEESEVINEGSFQIRYQRDNNHLFNASYRYRTLINSPLFILPPGIDSRIKQTDISGIWPIGSNWKVLGRWNYDHSNSRNLESFAGVEWSNCCATIRFIGREWVDENALFVPNIEPNRGVFVQLTLNGLGNLAGGGLSNLLQDGILGFRDANAQ